MRNGYLNAESQSQRSVSRPRAWSFGSLLKANQAARVNRFIRLEVAVGISTTGPFRRISVFRTKQEVLCAQGRFAVL